MGNGRDGSDGAPEARERSETGGWTPARTWVAGIVSAVLVAGIGVVFTSWYNAAGTDVVDRISGAAPVTIGHVSVETGDVPLALRMPVTDPDGRRVLLGGHVTPAERQALLTRHKAAPIGGTIITVVLTGRRAGVRIIDVKPRVLAREPRSAGAYLGANFGGEVSTVEIRADLDAAAPRFTTRKEPDVRYFGRKQIDLKKDERVTLSLEVEAGQAYYEFDLLVTVLADERSEQLVINGPDGPFRVTGKVRDFRSFYSKSDQGRWALMPTDQVCELFPKAKRC
ncbi:hypothetical protein [Nonomuraea typhae]|uniref:hypothetical protein n=1 Tax=Nonomuraea typhae TaxID=2603600 RepID=UPI0012F9988D|nr:hypothetical protein [Nonomuraea typhae]